MNSHLSSEQTPHRPTPSATTSAPFARADADDVRRDDVLRDDVLREDLGATLSQLSRDVASLKDTFARLASQASGEAAKTMRNMSEAVASQVGDVAGGVADTSSDLAASATQNVKTFASELEALARRNPLGTIAGALVVGVIVGMMSRGRG
jgi:ElaB/YqjD/DUF883 family membrane-anchored ribosome-binding protein